VVVKEEESVVALPSFDWSMTGEEVGAGEFDGLPEGWTLVVGELDGQPLGSALFEGELDGMPEGWTLGSFDGLPLGSALFEGELDGMPEGWALFEGELEEELDGVSGDRLGKVRSKVVVDSGIVASTTRVIAVRGHHSVRVQQSVHRRVLH
jgi:hypothetical protein